jgi:hypothetical protein
MALAGIGKNGASRIARSAAFAIQLLNRSIPSGKETNSNANECQNQRLLWRQANPLKKRDDRPTLWTSSINGTLKDYSLKSVRAVVTMESLFDVHIFHLVFG